MGRWHTAGSPFAREGVIHKKGRGSVLARIQRTIRIHRGTGGRQSRCGGGIPRLVHLVPELVIRGGQEKSIVWVLEDASEKSTVVAAAAAYPHVTLAVARPTWCRQTQPASGCYASIHLSGLNRGFSVQGSLA